MTFVVSEGSIQTLDRPVAQSATRLQLADDYSADYAEIWRTQPAVRTVVSFLARNIASLSLHTFERISDTDRRRAHDNLVAQILAKPNPRTTPFRLMDALVHDLGIYDAAYWLKLKGPGLLRLPPSMVRPLGDSWMWAESFEFKGGKGKAEFAADRVVHFHGYNPTDSRNGSSPIEALRRILAEEWEAGRMREQVLRNGARLSGYITRPAGAKEWSDTAYERFKRGWQNQYTGGGPQAGGTPILEDGMEFVPAAQTSEQLQYVAARKLTREEVAAAYFIPPPMVGLLDNATFSNIAEQHKMLYQDTLGPWLSMISEELGLQLIPDLLGDGSKIYVEFNLAEKLRGSFEEQAKDLQASVGAPWLLRSEARARMNLPHLEGADELVVPLNVMTGGQASPLDSDSTTGQLAGSPETKALPAGMRTKERAPATYEEKYLEVLTAFFDRQERSVVSALGAGGTWWDGDRWNGELAEDLWKLSIATSELVGRAAAADLGDAEAYDVDRTLAFLASVSQRVAGAVNAVTEEQIIGALADDDVDDLDATRGIFGNARSARAAQIATTSVTESSAFGVLEAARQLLGSKATKTWVTGSNPRSTHARMNGETVAVGEAFSNGMAYPGDSRNIHETAGCNCSIRVNRPEED